MRRDSEPADVRGEAPMPSSLQVKTGEEGQVTAPALAGVAAADGEKPQPVGTASDCWPGGAAGALPAGCGRGLGSCKQRGLSTEAWPSCWQYLSQPAGETARAGDSPAGRAALMLNPAAPCCR